MYIPTSKRQLPTRLQCGRKLLTGEEAAKADGLWAMGYGLWAKSQLAD